MLTPAPDTCLGRAPPTDRSTNALINQPHPILIITTATVSGEACEEPVLAKGSGVVYEKVRFARLGSITHRHSEMVAAAAATPRCVVSWPTADPPIPTLVHTAHTQRVILKYIESEGKDPATGEELTADDLLPIKSSKGAWAP